MPDIGFLNGRFMPLEQVLVPVEDRGFQFGDGVYEVIRTYRGVPYQLEAHLARLERSAQAIGLALPYRLREWQDFVREGLALGAHDESKVYIQVTRGVAPRDHAFPASTSPTMVMTVRALRPLDAALRETGVEAATMDDLRWGRCDIKSVNLLPNVMAKQKAKEIGAFEAIFLRNGMVTEGAVSNVMVVRGEVLMTAPEGERILSGVTRSVVLALARKAGVTVQERAVSVEELRSADEVFLTGTTVEVLAVVRLDGAPVGTGRPGTVTGLLSARFQASLG
ncbi:MAG: D-amino-acid transaminase [Nitrospira sp.]|nr:D-amino-acid transaminase [Nitrospira sp.]